MKHTNITYFTVLAKSDFYENKSSFIGDLCFSKCLSKKSTFLEWHYLQPVSKQYILDRQGTINLTVIEDIVNGTSEKRTDDLL